MKFHENISLIHAPENLRVELEKFDMFVRISTSALFLSHITLVSVECYCYQSARLSSFLNITKGVGIVHKLCFYTKLDTKFCFVFRQSLIIGENQQLAEHAVTANTINSGQGKQMWPRNGSLDKPHLPSACVWLYLQIRSSIKMPF